jgi:hypothetical protein
MDFETAMDYSYRSPTLFTVKIIDGIEGTPTGVSESLIAPIETFVDAVYHINWKSCGSVLQSTKKFHAAT